MAAALKRHWSFGEDSEDDIPLSQTDNARPRSRAASADLFLSGGGGEEKEAPARLASKKSIQDRVHGLIEMEAVLVAIIDTPQFQRLRSLKQLGCGDYVYPGASHTRFEHSLGVSFLAGEMLDHLMKVQPELDITRRDYLCVRIAGLCHDLGHGPFSHMFERFVNRIRGSQGKRPWHHEEASVAMVRMLLKDGPVRVQDYGLEPCDVEFICTLIDGLKPESPWPEGIGRGAEKRFLFDIVSNKRNGIDVDKLDYFLRDSTAALGKPPIDCDVDRLVHCARVCTVDGQTQICFEEKIALGLFRIFELRAWLHKYVYQHHTVKVIDDMMCDILNAAHPHFHVAGEGGALRKLSEAVEDMHAFMHLGDWILWAIEASADPGLTAARTLVRRLRSRDFYQAVYTPTHVPADILSEEGAKEAILTFADSRAAVEPDLVVHFVSIDYGSRNAEGKADNPLMHVRFFNPKSDTPHIATSLGGKKMSDLFTPRAFSERLLYVYTRSESSYALIDAAYKRWRAQLQSSRPTIELTPLPMANAPSPRKRGRPGRRF